MYWHFLARPAGRGRGKTSSSSSSSSSSGGGMQPSKSMPSITSSTSRISSSTSGVSSAASGRSSVLTNSSVHSGSSTSVSTHHSGLSTTIRRPSWVSPGIETLLWNLYLLMSHPLRPLNAAVGVLFICNEIQGWCCKYPYRLILSQISCNSMLYDCPY